MGTPEISAICLERLIKDGKEIVGVITGEDKVRGRGNTLSPTPVRRLAMEYGIPSYTPKTLKDEEFMKLLSELRPELIAVVAYGKILPKSVIDYPRCGCINVHVSLLPKYRGAAPMQRAIMNGEKETGVSIMYMDEGLDTGEVILKEKFPIGNKDNFESVHDKSAEIGSALLSQVIDMAENGRLVGEAQDDSLATYAKKIEKTDALIDFSLTAKEVDCIIRGLTPIPLAYCYQNGKMLKILSEEPTEAKGEPGEVIDVSGVGDGSITVACLEGAIKITALVPEGKGKMSAGDYVRGRKIFKGDFLNK